MYTIIAYIVGNIKYKRIFLNNYNNRSDVCKKYRELLDTYAKNPEFICVLLNDKFEILTCWALQTPINLKEAADLAIDKFEKGEELYIDTNIKLENLLGGHIYNELIDEGKEKGVF
jgi:hypothetical protein